MNKIDRENCIGQINREQNIKKLIKKWTKRQKSYILVKMIDLTRKAYEKKNE